MSQVGVITKGAQTPRSSNRKVRK